MATSGIDSPFIRDQWYALMWASELAVGKIVARRVVGQPLALYRKAGGGVAALRDLCPHRLVPLSLGEIVNGDQLQCHYHGLVFGADGRCVYNPHGAGAVPAALRAPAYHIEERHSLLWFWAGEGRGDPALIPDLGFIDRCEPRYMADPDYLHVRSDWRGIINNLMDLSHTFYVHRSILGDAEMAKAHIRVETQGDSVTLHRDPVEGPTPSAFMALLRAPRERSLHWNMTRWQAPGTVYLDAGVYALDESREQGTGFTTVHLITPETETTTHYMFIATRANPQSDPELDEPIRQGISAGGRFAFEHQDLPVIEAQQRRMEEFGATVRPALLADIDSGLGRVQQAIDRLLATQRVSATAA